MWLDIKVSLLALFLFAVVVVAIDRHKFYLSKKRIRTHPSYHRCVLLNDNKSVP